MESPESTPWLSTSCEVENAEWYKPQLKEAGSVWLEPSAEMGRQSCVCEQPRAWHAEVARTALEAAGVEFIDENGGGAGVRLRKI